MSRHQEDRTWGPVAAILASLSLSLALGCTDQSSDAARRNASARKDRDTQQTGEATLGTRSVTGTIKQVVDDGLVVYGHEQGESDREYAFVLEAATRIGPTGQLTSAGSLREGDSVTVVFSNRDGKVVAHSVVSTPPTVSSKETQ